MNKNLFELDSLFKSNKFDEVVLKTKKLIKKGEIIAPYYNLLGISLDNLGKIYEAEKNFRDAIKKNPNEISYYSNLSKILIKQNKLAEAEEFLNKALEIKSNDTFSLFEFGKLKTAQKDYFKALEFYQNVYKVEKQFPNALFMIGKTYVEISQDNKDVKYKVLALENLSECSKLFPENSDADFLLSELFDYSKEKNTKKLC